VKALALSLALALSGCWWVEPYRGPNVQTSLGSQPTVCYVRARNFYGYVPISCAEAILIRP